MSSQPSMGHWFDANLKCQAKGCNTDFSQHQENPQPCQGERPAPVEVSKLKQQLARKGITFAMIGERADGLSAERVRQLFRSGHHHRTETYDSVLKAAGELLEERGVRVA